MTSLIDEQSKSLGYNIADPESSAAQDVETDKPINKSERIRRYMRKHPEAGNQDITTALSKYGVKYGDVSNVKSQLRRKAEKQKGKARGKSATADTTGPATSVTSSTATPALDATINLDVLEAGVEFVRRSGGLNEAQHVLNVIRRINSLG